MEAFQAGGGGGTILHAKNLYNTLQERKPKKSIIGPLKCILQCNHQIMKGSLTET